MNESGVSDQTLFRLFVGDIYVFCVDNFCVTTSVGPDRPTGGLARFRPRRIRNGEDTILKNLFIQGRGVRFLSLLFIMGFLFSCGKAIRPSSMTHTLAIPVFENRTSEPILGRQVTAAFKETFTRRRFKVVRHEKEAAYILVGTITQFDKTPKSLHRDGKVMEYRLTIGVTYILSPRTGNTVSEEMPLKWNDIVHTDWVVRPDLFQDRSAQDRAIREIAQNLSQRATNTVTEFFSKKHS